MAQSRGGHQGDDVGVDAAINRIEPHPAVEPSQKNSATHPLRRRFSRLNETVRKDHLTDDASDVLPTQSRAGYSARDAVSSAASAPDAPAGDAFGARNRRRPRGPAIRSDQKIQRPRPRSSVKVSGTCASRGHHAVVKPSASAAVSAPELRRTGKPSSLG